MDLMRHNCAVLHVVVVEGGQETSKGMHSSKTHLTTAKLQNTTQK